MLITFLGWGSWHLLCRSATQRINPIAMQLVWALCAVISAPFFYLYMRFKHIPLSIHGTSLSGIGLAVLAFSATGIASMAYSICLTMRPVSEIVGIVSAYPVMVVALATPLFGEAFTWQKFAGIVMVWLGILMMSR
jgi:uncharacterized membrane protein